MRHDYSPGSRQSRDWQAIADERDDYGFSTGVVRLTAIIQYRKLTR